MAIAGVAKTVDGDIQGVIKSLTDLSKQGSDAPFEELAGIAELGGAMGIGKDELAAFTEQVAILDDDDERARPRTRRWPSAR